MNAFHISISALAATAAMIAAPVLAAQQSPKAGQTAPAEKSPAEASQIVAFWREAGPGMWFAKDPAFDRRFRDSFLPLYKKAARGELREWMQTPDGALALIILFDQFPRNSFRGTPKMYATDEAARELADQAIALGYDRKVADDLSLFFYLPFGHSENLADQERSVALAQRLGRPSLTHAEGHRDIIRKFGRFPHRNAILGRTMRPEEQKFLDEGGFAG